MRYFITSLTLQFYLLLFVVVVLIKRQNLIFFYIVLNMLLPKKIAYCCCSFFLTNGRDTRTLKRWSWTFSYLAPLIYQQKKTLNYFLTLNNLFKSPNAFFFFLKGIMSYLYACCMLSVGVSPHDELFSELLRHTCIKICLKNKWPSRDKGLFLQKNQQTYT